jgi:outer membrane protein OmpA-like peptidoglycan-associated protein
MRAEAKLAAIAAVAFIFQLGVAQGAPKSQVSTDDIRKALDSCPKGTVQGADGVCVHKKSGRMGFDLAAPDESDSAASQASNALATRSVSTTQKVVNLKLTFAAGAANLNDQDKANARALAAQLAQPKYSRAQVRIEVSADKDAGNADVSKQRADAVKTYLVSLGVDASRLDSVGSASAPNRMVIARRIK